MGVKRLGITVIPTDRLETDGGDMSRAIQIIIAAMWAMFGISGCGTSTQPSAPTPTPAAPSTPAAIAPAALSPCDDLAFLIDTVHGLQQGTVPPDPRAAEERVSDFAHTAPPDIHRSAVRVSGPAILAMSHREALGMVTTDDVNTDLQALESWRASHC
jgi:hypothetical protein